MNATLLLHLALENLVDQTVASRLHLSLESVRRDDEPEVRLFRRAPNHGLMMCVFMRIIEDLETGRRESVCQLS